MTTTTTTTTQDNQQDKWTGVRMSVKSGTRLDFVVDLSKLVNLELPEFNDSAWYGKATQPIKSCNIASIPAQRLRVAGMEDVFVDFRVYTKSNTYEVRKIRAEQMKAEAEAREKLEAVRAEAEKIAQIMGKSVEDVMTMLASQAK